MRKLDISLDELIEHYKETEYYVDSFEILTFEKTAFIDLLNDFGKELLELAARNAYIQDWYEDGKLVGRRINKKSITDTIKQITFKNKIKK